MTRRGRGARSTLARLAHLLLVLVIVTLAVSLLLDLTPGDPAAVAVGENASPEQIEIARHELGLDRPFIERYVTWVGNAVQGDFGRSFRTNQPISDALRDRIPVTLQLAGMAMLLALVIAIPVGVWSGYRQGGRLDRVMQFLGTGMLAAPSFVAALLLIYFFSVKAGIFPVTGWVTPSEDLAENLRHAALPVIVLALPEAAAFARILRTDVAATLQEDYIAAARAKGLTTRYVLFRHALRPSSMSLLTISAISLGRIIGGAVIVENIFALPGLGQYTTEAIFSKDIIAVQAVVVFLAVAYVLINACVEVAYRLFDPRVAAS